MNPVHEGMRALEDAIRNGKAFVQPGNKEALVTAILEAAGARIYGDCPGITKRQAECRDFIVEFQKEHGISPSYDEICAGINAPSKSTVARLLDCLEERGVIRRIPFTVRSVEVLR